MRKKVRIVSAVLCVTFLAGLLGGCRNEEQNKGKGTTEEIRIPAIFTVDPSPTETVGLASVPLVLS